VYELALVGVAWWLAVAVVRRPWDRVPLDDLVVELAGTGRAEGLARAVGDPTLRVLPVTSATPRDPARTVVQWGGAAVAVLAHDPALGGDAALQDAVDAVATLTAAHARLEAEVCKRVEEVSASRRRLLHAAEDERRRLELELRERAGTPLVAIRDRLAGVGGSHADVERLVAQASGRIERALEDLDAVARGLHPRALADGGLLGGLRELAAVSPTVVEVRAELPPLPDAVAATAYYVCAEAAANAAKHARARSIVIDAGVRDGRLALSVSDDGAGGAHVVRGGGLEGLRDRVEATGGAFRLESRPAGGTRVEVAFEL
jgi:signal transduction histidine kinase